MPCLRNVLTTELCARETSDKIKCSFNEIAKWVAMKHHSTIGKFLPSPKGFLTEKKYSQLRFIRTLWSRLFLSELSGEISLSELTRDTRHGANPPIFTIYTVKL